MAYGGSDAAMNELISDDLLLFECFLGFLPCTTLLILTQGFGMYICIFCLISAPLARALKPQIQLIGWNKKWENGKSEDGVNCEISLTLSVYLSRKQALRLC